MGGWRRKWKHHFKKKAACFAFLSLTWLWHRQCLIYVKIKRCLEKNQTIVPAIFEALHHLPFRPVMAAQTMKNETWAKAQGCVEWRASSRGRAAFILVHPIREQHAEKTPAMNTQNTAGYDSGTLTAISGKTSAVKQVPGAGSVPAGRDGFPCSENAPRVLHL